MGYLGGVGEAPGSDCGGGAGSGWVGGTDSGGAGGVGEVGPVTPSSCHARAHLGLAREASQVSADLLLPLDRLEQGLEVALAEAEGAVSLDQLEEDRRSVLDGLGEDLEEVAVLVAV